jgi:hypothetical protein
MNFLRWAVPSLVVVACNTNAPVQDTSTPRPRGLVATAPAPTAPPPAADTPPDPEPPAAPAPTNTDPFAEYKEKSADAPEPEKPPERDLNAELLQAIGSPTDCLKPRSGDTAPNAISIDYDVTVLETGLVTRAYAHSSQLDEEELQCATKRASALHLRAPIDQAPRSLHATLQLTAKNPEKTAN